jgi:hypothetical protein
MPGPQVKNWSLYHKLRKKGKTKSSSARLANYISKKRKKS